MLFLLAHRHHHQHVWLHPEPAPHHSLHRCFSLCASHIAHRTSHIAHTGHGLGHQTGARSHQAALALSNDSKPS
eukprot:1608110-Rhodomonas_salina.1